MGYSAWGPKARDTNEVTEHARTVQFLRLTVWYQHIHGFPKMVNPLMLTALLKTEAE